MKNFLIFLTALQIVTVQVRADVLDITKTSQTRLAYGVDPITEKVFEKCIDSGNDETAPEDGADPNERVPKSAFDMPFSVEQITSSSQMDRYSSSSVSASASYGIYSGSFSYAAQNKSALFSDQASVGIEAVADYGRWYLKKTTLKPEYAQLATRDLKEFFRVCGPEYVVGYRLGQGLRVVLSTSTLVTETYSSMQASVQGGVNAGVGSANLAGAFMETAYNLLKMGSLTVKLTSFGSGPLNELSKLVNTNSEVTAFRDNIANLLSTMTPDKSVRTHYITRPYFPSAREYDALLTEHKRRVVLQLYSDYRQLYDTQDRLNTAFTNNRIAGFLRETCRNSKDVCDAYVDGLKKVREQIGLRLDEIQSSVRKCSAANKLSECSSRAEVPWEMSELQHIVWPPAFRYQMLQAELDRVRGR